MTATTTATTTATYGDLDRLQSRIDEYEAYSERRRTGWAEQLPRLMVTRIEQHGADWLAVTLAPLGAGDGKLTVYVPAEAEGCRLLRLGCSWDMVPGVRQQRYDEKLQAARKALRDAGGILGRLSEGDQELICENERPF